MIEQLRDGYKEHRAATRRHREHVRKDSQLSEEEMTQKMKRLTVCYLHGLIPDEEDDLRFLSKMTNIEFKAKLEKIIAHPKQSNPPENTGPKGDKVSGFGRIGQAIQTKADQLKEKKEVTKLDSEKLKKQDPEKPKKQDSEKPKKDIRASTGQHGTILSPTKKELEEAIKKKRQSSATTTTR